MIGLLVFLLVPALGLSLVTGDGDALLAVAPLAALALAVMLVQSPLRHSLFVLLTVALCVDNPLERPAVGRWKSVLYPIGELLYLNLGKLTGIEALRFSFIEVAIFGLAAAALLRRPESELTAIAPPLRRYGILYMLAFSGMELWGILGGGDFKQSLWQLRELFWLPAAVYVFQRSLRTSRDFSALAKVWVFCATVKAGIGFYFYEVIMRPLNLQPHYATSHSDTMLFVGAMVIVLAVALQEPTRDRLVSAVGVCTVVLVGIIVNNRRLAFVSLAMSMLVLFMHLSAATKRSALRLALLLSPIALVYIVVGWGSESLLFRPVKTIASVVSQEDRSSGTRDIENFNLIYTLKQRPLLGSGAGHEYIEKVQADSIAEFFAQYRYIGHNSVLWLWSLGGLVFTTALWLPLVVAVFLAQRAWLKAQTAQQRAMASICISAVIIYFIQAWGDMGMQNWTSVWLLAGGLVGASKLAMEQGAV